MKIVKDAEEYYPRPPILVKISIDHPFFGNKEKSIWTDEILDNVREDDVGNSGGVFSDGWV